MGSEQDNTAILAIVIALIAFFVTTAQLLQALFGTAVGYRQCQPSVMGQWATKTKRKWRWSEFRFETIFTTPNIFLVNAADEPHQNHKGIHLIKGDIDSRRETYSTPSSQKVEYVATGHVALAELPHDLVGWLSLLNMLHLTQERVFEMTTFDQTESFLAREIPRSLTYPAITFRTRSWDFMPPDIVRPFAASWVGDMIALAHRLGMRWKEIRPDDGVLRAEGNGQSITSTTVRGFGLLLQYSFDRAIVDKGPHYWDLTSSLTIPSWEADSLGFQIVRGSEDLRLPDFIFDVSAGFAPVGQVMSQLGINRNTQDMYAQFFHRSDRLYGFSDLIGMVAPFLPLPGSTVIQIFAPYPQFHDSPTNWWEGFVVYRARLIKSLKEQAETGWDSEQMKWVLDRFEYLRWTYPWDQCPSWEGEIENKKVKNGRSVLFLNDIRHLWSTTTTYFKTLRRKENRFRYIDLVGAHIAQAVYYPDLAEANIKAGTDKRFELGHLRSKRVAEGMHIYVDQIPKVVDFMKEKGFDDARVTTEAWWTLILRAMCWHRSIAFIEIPKANMVSPTFYGSRLPVYIA